MVLLSLAITSIDFSTSVSSSLRRCTAPSESWREASKDDLHALTPEASAEVLVNMPTPSKLHSQAR